MSSNFRHQLLSLSLLVGIAAPWAAFAQAPISSVGSGSVEDRVTQLERISNAHSQLLTQLQQQLSDNQSDIDSLRGQIQENQYQLNQVVERQKQILLQIDSLSSGGAAAQSTSSDQSGAAASTTPTADAGTANAGAPVKSGDANTDYNAAIALVQDKSRQDDAMVAYITDFRLERNKNFDVDHSTAYDSHDTTRNNATSGRVLCITSRSDVFVPV